MNYAYISGGRLYVSRNGAQPVEIESAFAAQVIARHQQSIERRQWKAGSGDGMMTRGYDLWGNGSRGGSGDDSMLVRMLSVTGSPKPELIYYSLATDAVGGLFCQNLDTGEERRVFHKERYHLDDLAHHPTRDEILAVKRDADGSSIVITACERFDVHTVTEGDSLDLSPSWIPGEDDSFVYQSAGVGRNQSGNAIGLGPCSIIRVDMKSGRSTVLLEDEQFDYLCPRMDKEGNLYCIRRKYDRGGRALTVGETIKEFVLVPVRLVKAFFGFLNMMSQIFGKESLLKTGVGGKKEIDRQEVFLKGRLIDLKKRENAKEEHGIAPSDWTLIKVDPGGVVFEVRGNVCDFDWHPQSGLILTNGLAVSGEENSGWSSVYKGKDIIEYVRCI
ncbi:MAG: hypothetical protein JW706_03020 [Opitutales bacterium]|nr:hypothetical protein [Opitutales bacterium]